MGWVVSSNRLACMIIQAKVITIHLVEQKGILRVKISFSHKHTFVCRKAWFTTENLLKGFCF